MVKVIASSLRKGNVVEQDGNLHVILTAENDPFVPVEPFRRELVGGNPHLQVVITPDGGHCAFVEPATDDYDGYWAEREIVRFANAHEATDVTVRLYPYVEPAGGR